MHQVQMSLHDLSVPSKVAVLLFFSWSAVPEHLLCLSVSHMFVHVVGLLNAYLVL